MEKKKKKRIFFHGKKATLAVQQHTAPECVPVPLLGSQKIPKEPKLT